MEDQEKVVDPRHYNKDFDGRPSLYLQDALLERLIEEHGPQGRPDLFVRKKSERLARD
jgi:hypothetical protein